jgi:REP element-mobilizing transposase RayT
MKFDPQKHHRRSIRLRGYDYTQPGAYFITIVTYQRQHLFGEVVSGEMQLNEMGQIAHDEWLKTAQLRSYVKMYEDEFIVMPNHVHGIIWIESGEGGDIPAFAGARRRRAPECRVPTDRRAPTDDHTERFGKPVSHSIPTIVRAYKSAVTYAINAVQHQRGATLWQRNYYERVIGNEPAYENIYRYILSNPLHWEENNEKIKR